MTAPSPVRTDVVHADPELQRVLNIVRHIGAVSGDDVNISYTSLFIGLMWSGDATSTWLEEKLGVLGPSKGAVYAQRNIERNAARLHSGAGRLRLRP